MLCTSSNDCLLRVSSSWANAADRAVGIHLVQLLCDLQVVSGNLLQHAKADGGHGVNADPLDGRYRAQELEDLPLGIGHVRPRNVRLVDQQNGCTRARRIGRGSIRRAVGEAAIDSQIVGAAGAPVETA